LHDYRVTAVVQACCPPDCPVAETERERERERE